MSELKRNVEQIAREQRKTEVEIISGLQASCAANGRSDLLVELCELKWEYIQAEDHRHANHEYCRYCMCPVDDCACCDADVCADIGDR